MRCYSHYSGMTQKRTDWLLARRFTLNPVVVVISLVFWFWMWGIPGAILLCPCWRLPRSYAIAFGRWLHSVIFLRGEAKPIYLDLALLRAAGAGRRRLVERNPILS